MLIFNVHHFILGACLNRFTCFNDEIALSCNRGKGWNSNEVFQAAEKSGFCGRELLPLVCTLEFCNFADHLHAQKPI